MSAQTSGIEVRPLSTVLNTLVERYRRARSQTEELCEPLTTEDYVIQSMEDASPVRWHIGHTTWFFETFILLNVPGNRPFNPDFAYLFNSYYNAVGPQFPSASRGLISRPTVQEIIDYRRYVDRHIVDVLESDSLDEKLRSLVELGIQHEQQHQELILTDVKHLLSQNPLFPTYRPGTSQSGRRSAMSWVAFDKGLRWIGHDGEAFAFDNETPGHRVFLEEFEIAARLVTNEEFLAFIEDDGYQRPEYWLSEGWKTVTAQSWRHPLYWI